jgi:hypothetical protein
MCWCALHCGGRPRRLLADVLRGDHTVIIGPAILGELEDVLVETCGWASDRPAAVRAELEAFADAVTPAEVPHVGRDPDDDQILAIAVIAAVDARVTGTPICSRSARMAASTSPPSQTSRCWRGAQRGGPLRAHPHHVDAIPTKSITRALVVIPTISRRKHSRSSSIRIANKHVRPRLAWQSPRGCAFAANSWGSADHFRSARPTRHIM